jgi:hypothetical protein
MRRRDQQEDLDNELERQTLNLNPEQWVKLYRDRVLAGIATPDGEGEVQLTEDDLDELDRFMEEQERAFRENLNGRHTMAITTPDLHNLGAIPEDQWGAWL